MNAILLLSMMLLTPADYDRCARRIVQALQLQAGEAVLLKLDPELFTPIIAPLQREIRRSGAFVVGTLLSETSAAGSERELEAMRRLFSGADVLIWLPERSQGNTSSVTRALTEWLDAGRGRAVHFHWSGGTIPLGDQPLPAADQVDRLYMAALDADGAAMEAAQRRAMAALQSGVVHVTTPDGTDIRFQAGDRPFTLQVGDASRRRMESARVRIDRDIELPAGALRVAPIETSAEGVIVIPVWRLAGVEGRNIRLTFTRGRVTRIEGQRAAEIERILDGAGGAARMFREFGLGFNPLLAVPADMPFIPYYGYGAGVVRLSLGDNEEMGGANRGGGVYWNFFHNATVSVGERVLVRDGRLADR